MPTSAQEQFAYTGTLPTGMVINGTLEAVDQAAAVAILEKLHVKIGQIQAVAATSAPSRAAGPLGSEDFKTFNQQLVLLVQSGMPVEYGLRLLAADLRRGRLAKTIATISSELDSGLTLPEAIERHRNEFPADYARLLDAGIRSNNLSAVLLNLEAHLELTQKLGDALRRALYYPMFVALALLAVLSFLDFYVLPLYRPIVDALLTKSRYGYGLHQLPLVTRLVLAVGSVLPEILVGLGVLIGAWLIFWITCHHRPVMLRLRDWVACHLPFIGPPLRLSLLERWCGALNVAVAGGMNLPQALDLAGTISGSPRVRADGAALAQALSQGAKLAQVPSGRIIPKTAVMMVQAGMENNNLSDTLVTMGESYRRQAETRIAALVPVLSMAALLLIAAVVVVLMLAVFLPLVDLMGKWAG